MKDTMHQTPARQSPPPRDPYRSPRPRRPEPEPEERDVLAMIVRGGLAAVFGCGGAAVLLLLLALILSLVLG
jgi:hypothetical protein